MSKFTVTSLAVIGNKGKAEAIVANNEKVAATSIRSQISKLENARVDAEIALERAVEAYSQAITPSVEITNRNSYVSSILSADEAVKKATRELEIINSDISFFTSLFNEYFVTEVAG